MRVTFKVRLRLFARASGGRSGPIRSDYRPDWNIGNTWRGKPTLNGARVLLEDRSELAPGDEGLARIEPLAPEFWVAVCSGQVIPIHEGPHVVGEATVLEKIEGPG